MLVRDPEDKGSKAHPLFSTAHDLTAWHIVERCVMRWRIEMTFWDSRRHLEGKSPRQWSDKAIERTTPTLLARFSMVCLRAVQISKGTALAMVRQRAWPVKQEAVFSDVLACVRRGIWSHQYFVNSAPQADCVQLPAEAWDALMYQLTATA
ncbi:hypothetical protein [Candidatus Magnetaquiglobus chichijimensis]|uniref:hypothetical protein n=1 Tax=Candidatus Magnetaquiglobus chichijimensis TaxID=3141448 RepID=UPI003B972DBA